MGEFIQQVVFSGFGLVGLVAGRMWLRGRIRRHRGLA